jgi:uncharacterized protein
MRPYTGAMSNRSHEPRRFDVAAAAADAVELTGVWPLVDLRRLIDDHPAEAGPLIGDVRWSAKAYQRPVGGGEPETWLRLVAEADLWRVCQRCLQPMVVPLKVDRTVRFVADEQVAADLDADSEDDVLALPRWLDLRELVEDELLLALPLVPRHEVCPQPLPMVAEADPVDDEPPEPHPFAALAALKRGRGPH